MPLVEIYGATVVSFMALFYALEGRGSVYILFFAFACLASSGYAVAIQSWPFAIIEFLWSGIAFRRWRVATVKKTLT